MGPCSTRNSGKASLGFVLQEGLETRKRCPFFTPRGKARGFLTWDNSRGGSGAFEQEECLGGLPVHSVVLVCSTSEAAGFCGLLNLTVRKNPTAHV